MTTTSTSAAVTAALAEGARWIPEQIDEEFVPLCELVANLRPHNVIEIGVRRGGTAAVWHTLSTGTVIGIDLPDDFSRARKEALEAAYPRLSIVLGDSHDAATKHEALWKLSVRRVDFLFIDGDHSYDGCKRDYEMYSPLVRAGGIIAFHDIADTPFMRSVDNDVWRFWQELDGVGDKQEFYAGGDWGGIGAIKA